jgi:hypothetical protein
MRSQRTIFMIRYTINPCRITYDPDQKAGHFSSQSPINGLANRGRGQDSNDTSGIREVVIHASSGLSSIAENICKNQTICIVSFWDDKSKVATGLPMTDEQVNSKVASYNLNKIWA